MTTLELQEKLDYNEFSIILRLSSLFFFIYVLFKTAWVTEDAIISFRVIDNLLNGFGPVYNVGERVQVFTNPLFTFILSIFVFFTKEFYYTSIAFCSVLSIATMYFLGWKIARSPLIGGLLILTLSLSFSFIKSCIIWINIINGGFEI
jgi:arabinofuranosyltransferase